MISRRLFLAATAGAAALPALPAPVRAALPRGDDALVGEFGYYVARFEDTLMDIARWFDLGFVELRAANPNVNPWVPGEGTPVLLPTAHLLPDAPRRGIVINLGDLRIYWHDGGEVMTFPVGIGQDGWGTPKGSTFVVRKKEAPAWYPPASIRAEKPELPAMVPPGPDNPLGDHAIYLGWPAYLIHGTNKPDGVGRRVSHGCIRMYPEDVAVLFGMVGKGTPVTVVDQPVKIGWHRGVLYLEVHPEKDQIDEIEVSGTFSPLPIAGLSDRVAEAAGIYASEVDWAAVDQAAAARHGMPVPVAQPAGLAAAREGA